MKRYTHDYDYGSNLKVSPNGEWVRHEDVKEMEELNRELIAVLQSAEWACAERWRNEIDYCCPTCGELIYKGHSNSCKLATILAKAEEVGE